MTPDMEQRIDITVSPDGTASIKTSGFTGSSCRDATRQLERALGIAGRETLLPEFHGQVPCGEQIRQGH